MSIRPIAVTMGEPGGIGREITLRAWQDLRHRQAPPFCVFADPQFLREAATEIGIEIIEIAHPREAGNCFTHGVPVIPIELSAAVKIGSPSPSNAQAVIQSITDAVALCLDDHAGAIVTNPIDKQALQTGARFEHPGHTEFLARLASSDTPPVMMLVANSLRVVPATVHIPLAAVPSALSVTHLITIGETVAAALTTEFDIPTPRVAISGLNPHAGEGGMLGEEESAVVAPAIRELNRRGICTSGPHPADALFTSLARKKFDAAICMYHDQALIPIKALDFAHCVNLTLGLPFVRTSPGHGVAYDIAGQGVADPTSLISAILLAGQLARKRTTQHAR